MRPPSKTLFVEPKFKGSPFEVRGIGFRERMAPGLVNRPSGTGDFFIVAFHTPAGTALARDALRIQDSHLFFWTPGQAQHYGNPKRAYLHSWIHCAGAAIAPLLRGNGISPHVPLVPGSLRPFLRFLEDLYREVSLASPDGTIARNLFENWLRDLGRSLSLGGKSVPAPLLAAREFMDAHYAEPLALADYARAAHWSPSHFSAEFRRHFGHSPIDYVIRRRLHHATYLLRNVNLSVTEVARTVGYDDLFYFSKLFKKFYRTSPRAFRRP